MTLILSNSFCSIWESFFIQYFRTYPSLSTACVSVFVGLIGSTVLSVFNALCFWPTSLDLDHYSPNPTRPVAASRYHLCFALVHEVLWCSSSGLVPLPNFLQSVFLLELWSVDTSANFWTWQRLSSHRDLLLNQWMILTASTTWKSHRVRDHRNHEFLRGQPLIACY